MTSDHHDEDFRVGFSADIVDDHGALFFSDIGLPLLNGIPGLAHEFLLEYRPEYVPNNCTTMT